MTKRRKRISDFKPDVLDRRGIAWFESEEYSRILEIVNYPSDMPRDYEIWRQSTEDNERYWKGRFAVVVRVIVHPDEFIAWCEARAIDPNRDAIRLFVNHRTYGFVA